MIPAQRQYEKQIAAMADSYRQQGYKVSMPADREAVPFDLHGFVPDLLAEKDAEHLLVLANSADAPLSIGRLQELTATVKQQPGWRLLVVNLSSRSEIAGILQDPLSWSAILERIAQARRLREAGEAEAAILLFWSALEALLRRHAESVALPLEHSPVRALLDYLYSEADLSYEYFDQAKNLLVGRNRLAHGFPLPEASQQAAQLQGLVENLSNDWLPLRNVA
ncbi:MAG TPA: hypothetical protein VFO93_10980 [Hymenobacter sp.]|uniref:hypothetical protein n=1 Tax=Hymenobacter sp. TaxID=1898978 RepID=UPI002D7E9914|nr:hypothetical protein [Hymenobacter sp.]HET9504057.1 hypothetical protein [Hymenobacter sp.]